LKFEEIINAVQTKPLFQYTGSLTTPPCAEGLTFLVLEEPLPINVKTYNALKSVIKFNARYSQNSLGETNLLQVASELSAKASGSCCHVTYINTGSETNVLMSIGCELKSNGTESPPILVEPIANNGGKESESPSKEEQHEKIVECLHQCSSKKRAISSLHAASL
jgi:hypothetical protein